MAIVHFINSKSKQTVKGIYSVFKKTAKLVNKKYHSKRLKDSPWYTLSTIKQASNVYSSLNIRLKLNLLGYDYIREDKVKEALDTLNEKFHKVNPPKKCF